jgi:lipid II:glycine glycyltransferase (peptidoglycan interpeptide bridge formation enzyme)
MGKVCLPIVSGTGDKALQFKASFLLFWGMVQHAKESGAAFCDTAGVHEKRNPGSYFFKKGLAGKDAQEAAYLGQFDAYKSYPSFLLFKTAMAAREKIINGARNAKAWLR